MRRLKLNARGVVMSSRPELKLDWCTHEAAKYAVEHWHYSKSLPAGKSVKIGAWESGRFIGCVYFSLGANQNIHKPYSLKPVEVCELTRVALGNHANEVSKILALAIKFLKKACPGIRLVVSYADTGQGHHGGIYQACGWPFTGTHGGESNVVVNGRMMHRRQAYSLYGTNLPEGSRNVPKSAKHKYLMPLDDEMRAKIEPLRQPYPKRVRSADSGTSGIQSEGGGATPTRTLLNPPLPPMEKQ